MAKLKNVLFITQACPFEDVPGTFEGDCALGAGLHASHNAGLAAQGESLHSSKYENVSVERSTR